MTVTDTIMMAGRHTPERNFYWETRHPALSG